MSSTSQLCLAVPQTTDTGGSPLFKLYNNFLKPTVIHLLWCIFWITGHAAFSQLFYCIFPHIELGFMGFLCMYYHCFWVWTKTKQPVGVKTSEKPGRVLIRRVWKITIDVSVSSELLPVETEINPSFPKCFELLNPANLLQGTGNLPGIPVCLGASAVVAGRSRHPDVNAGNEGIFSHKAWETEEMLLFSFLDMIFFSLFQPAFQFLSCAIGILSHCRLFLLLLKTGIKMPMNVSWRSASIIQRLWGTERGRPRHFVPVTADEEAICLRSVSRLLSQICFLFFLLFPPQLHLHTFLGERDEDSAFLAAAGGTNCSRSDFNPAALILGVSCIGDLLKLLFFFFWPMHPMSLLAAAFTAFTVNVNHSS